MILNEFLWCLDLSGRLCNDNMYFIIFSFFFVCCDKYLQPYQDYPTLPSSRIPKSLKKSKNVDFLCGFKNVDILEYHVIKI